MLNFPDAMKLASILSKYINRGDLSKITGEDFICDVLGNLTEDEFGIILELLTVPMERSMSPANVLQLCVYHLAENRLSNLLATYDGLGFSK